MRKGFRFIPTEQVVTHVYDAVSKAVPDQSLSLREMLMQFAYMSGEKLEEIVNRGYDGDEDDDILGVDVGQLDYAEVGDRIIEMRNTSARGREPVTEPVTPEDKPSDTPPATPEDTPEADA